MYYAKRKYYRAYSIAEFICEGHNLKQTMEEFRISDATVYRDLNLLADYGMGEKLLKNRLLSVRARRQLKKRKKSS